MKILAIEKDMPGVNEKDFTPHLKNEARQAWDLYKSGKIREMYFSNNNYAVLILEADNAVNAGEILSLLPLVKEKLIDFEIIPLNAYTGFERIFEKV